MTKPGTAEETTTLYIKNMVCNRCIRVVGEELSRLGLHVRRIELGEAEIRESVPDQVLVKVRATLEANGFELIEDRKAKIIEQIKVAIVRLVHHNHDEKPMKIKISAYLEKEMNLDYHYMSSLFSSFHGITLEQYFIQQRIERAKELLKYGELTLSEIAYQMGYSSVQHLSNQFKSVTGMSPTEFKRLGRNTRVPLDHVAP